MAQTPVVPVPPRPHAVLVVVSGVSTARGARLGALLDALHTSLSDDLAPVTFVAAPAGTVSLREKFDWTGERLRESEARAAVWVELEPADATVYVFDGAQVRMRQVRSKGGLEASAEALSIIVRSTVAALADELELPDMVAVPVPPPPPRDATPPAPAAPSVARPRVGVERGPLLGDAGAGRVRIGLGYVGRAYAPQAPWASGLGLSLTVFLDPRVYASAGYTFVVPIEVTSREGEARVRLAPRPIDAALGYELPLSGRVRLGVEAGADVEPISRTTVRATAPYEATAAASGWSLALATRARGSLLLAPHVRLYASVGVEAFVRQYAYVAPTDERLEVVVPRTFQPQLGAGAAVDLW